MTEALHSTNTRDRNLLVLLAFLLLAGAVRLSTLLFSSALDWDESLYILGAEALLEGNLPYLTVWDHKPPGIFGLFAVPISVIADPIIAVRILALIAVASTSFLLWKTFRAADKSSNFAGIIAGVLYTVFSLGNGGTASNTELFYVPLVLSAFYIATRAYAFDQPSDSSLRVPHVLGAGLLLGLGGAINYLALFYSVPVALLLIFGPPFPWSDIKAATRVLVQRVPIAALLSVGPIAVFSVIAGVYATAGELDEFIYANFTSNRMYVSEQPYDVLILVKVLADQFSGHWFLWVSAGALALIARSGPSLTLAEKRATVIGTAWLATGLLAVATSRLYWSHYFLQLNPALCLLAAVVVARILKPASDQSRVLAVCGLLLLVLGGTYNLIRDTGKLAASIAYHRFVQGERHWGDPAAQIGAFIEKRIQRGDHIFVVDYSPIIYSLADAEMPTRFVFPPFLIGNESAKLINVPVGDEIERIFASHPRYVVKKKYRPDPVGTLDSVYSAIDRELADGYVREHTFDDVDLYRRR